MGFSSSARTHFLIDVLIFIVIVLLARMLASKPSRVSLGTYEPTT